MSASTTPRAATATTADPPRLGLRRYGALLSTPHAPRLAGGSVVGRVGQAGASLAILLAAHEATGSFGVAGLASGAATAAASVSRLAQGRLIDRRGPSAVLVTSSLVHLAACAALAAVGAARTSALAFVALAALSGASTPALGAITRTLWTKLVARADRTLAHAFEAIVTEAAYIAGPALGGATAAALSPSAAIAAMGLLTSAGAIAVAGSGASRAWTSPRSARREAPFARPLLAPLAIMLVLGVMGGSVDVAVTAFASQTGRQGLAGLLLAVWAAGSVAGGLAYGARHWRWSEEARLVACLLALPAVLALMPLAGSPPALGGLLVVAGLPIAPALTTLFVLTERRAPRERLTEALAWASSPGPAGVALGMTLAGWTIAAGGVATAFRLAAAVCLPAAGGALLMARAARRDPAATPSRC